MHPNDWCKEHDCLWIDCIQAGKHPSAAIRKRHENGGFWYGYQSAAIEDIDALLRMVDELTEKHRKLNQWHESAVDSEQKMRDERDDLRAKLDIANTTIAMQETINIPEALTQTQVRCAELYEENKELRAKLASADPEWDATDGAHPCWWRGHDNGADGTAKLLGRVANGELDEHYFGTGAIADAVRDIRVTADILTRTTRELRVATSLAEERRERAEAAEARVRELEDGIRHTLGAIAAGDERETVNRLNETLRGER